MFFYSLLTSPSSTFGNSSVHPSCALTLTTGPCHPKQLSEVRVGLPVAPHGSGSSFSMSLSWLTECRQLLTSSSWKYFFWRPYSVDLPPALFAVPSQSLVPFLLPDLMSQCPGFGLVIFSSEARLTAWMIPPTRMTCTGVYMLATPRCVLVARPQVWILDLCASCSPCTASSWGSSGHCKLSEPLKGPPICPRQSPSLRVSLAYTSGHLAFPSSRLPQLVSLTLLLRFPGNWLYL